MTHVRIPLIVQILCHDRRPPVNNALGVLLALAALALGYLGYGWPGVVLALTVVIFWLLLQFSRALRVLRAASARPVGTVANAVMLQARLQRGMSLQAVLRLTGSLGRQVEGEAETFIWHDAGGDQVRLRLVGGKLSEWQLLRAPQGPGPQAAA
jgi:hypothetical protein